MTGAERDFITARELELFRAEMRDRLRALDERITHLDEHGTRGVGALEQRLIDAIADIAEIKAKLAQGERDRSASRRWLVGIGFTVAGVVVATLSLLVDILQKRLH